jgi:hypothetical protein
MTLTSPSLVEDLKETILREHPDGIWIVLGEEFPQAPGPDLTLLAGHPTTTSVQAAERGLMPR